MEWMKIDRESAAATYDSTWRVFSEDGGIPEAGLKLVIDQGREAMKIEGRVATAEVADLVSYAKCTRSWGQEVEKNGVLEQWSIGVMGCDNQISTTPSLQFRRLL